MSDQNISIFGERKLVDLDNLERFLVNVKSYLNSSISGKLDSDTAANIYLAKDDAAITYLGINAKAKTAALADSATSATRATQDAAGRNITTTYATKTENDAKYTKPSSGIPKDDLASDVQVSLSKADTALQSHQDISGKLDKTEASSTYLTKTDAASTYLGKTAKAADATKADSATKATQDASGNVITTTYATKTELTNGLASKVSTVSGKGLSTNDYTTTEKNKLAGIAAGAEVNVQSDWNETSTTSDAYIKNKPTIPTALKNPNSLTVGSKTYDGSTAITINAADLGLGQAMKYIGKTTTDISESTTSNVITINSKSVTAAQGDVVIDKDSKKEYIWNGSSWEEFGNEGNYKTKQTAVSSPSASGNTTSFIDTISQDANGVITATKKNIPNVSTSANGLMLSTDKSKLDGIASGATAVTESTVSGWGFSKTTGTYSKPSGGIPKSDLATAVQTSLGKADSALQAESDPIFSASAAAGIKSSDIANWNGKTSNTGTITAVQANGSNVSTAGVANIPAATTSTYGVTKLTSSTSSTSEVLAATAKAVKAAYDLAASKTSNTGTITGIKMNGASKGTSGVVDLGTVITDVSGKQDKLTSGTNIKTINGASVLGSGDITVGNVYAVSPGTTLDGVDVIFYSKPSSGIPKSDLASAVQTSLNKADTALQSVPAGYATTTQVNAKQDNIAIVNVTATSQAITPNKFYKWTSAMSSLTITFTAPTNTSIYNEYMFEFTTSSSGCTLALPSSVKWMNGEAPEIEASSTYQVSVVNNLAVYAKF